MSRGAAHQAGDPNQDDGQDDANVATHVYFNGKPIALWRSGWLTYLHHDQLGNLGPLGADTLVPDAENLFAYNQYLYVADRCTLRRQMGDVVKWCLLFLLFSSPLVTM